MTARGAKAVDWRFRCAFCRKSGADVRSLFEGKGAVAICDECVRLFRDLLAAPPAAETRDADGGFDSDAGRTRSWDVDSYNAGVEAVAAYAERVGDPVFARDIRGLRLVQGPALRQPRTGRAETPWAPSQDDLRAIGRQIRASAAKPKPRARGKKAR